ncbi:hypothetical protein M885DRAFT_542647 [Pelagophyceae sp. CCMP2097]|nr:hypothetical protein M885DRAFT_542647 [Pelagophyceae sp. CCMP2097]
MGLFSKKGQPAAVAAAPMALAAPPKRTAPSRPTPPRPRPQPASVAPAVAPPGRPTASPPRPAASPPRCGADSLPRRRFSNLSEQRLATLDDLKLSVTKFEVDVETIAQSGDAKQAPRLVMILGMIDKLQFEKVDAVSTTDLHSGKDKTKATRKALNRRIDVLRERAQAVQLQLRNTPAAPEAAAPPEAVAPRHVDAPRGSAQGGARPAAADGPEAPVAARIDVWIAKFDAGQQATYYFNPATCDSTWILPPGAKVRRAQLAEQRVAAWMERFDEAQGCTYYYNADTAESLWTLPNGATAVPLISRGDGDAVHTAPRTPQFAPAPACAS